MPRGYLMLVLHAHLPFVRHPEHERFLEEAWLYEAITETYLPLTQVLYRLQNEQLDFRLTLSVSPPLMSMLLDPLLMRRFATYLEQRIDLAHAEHRRTGHRLAAYYRDHFLSLRDTWRHVEGNLIAAFKRWHDAGRIELITTTATHIFAPVAGEHRPSLRAQIEVATRYFESVIGEPPAGMWLAECGYVAALSPLLREAGLRFVFLDAHGLLFADPPPRLGIFAPVFTPSAVAAFARDPDSSQQVWSADHGYPGDPVYREFYRDLGFDRPAELVAPYWPTQGIPGFTGLKFHRITGAHVPLGDKAEYDPVAAIRQAQTHAAHFLSQREQQIDAVATTLDRPPLIVAPYDAELFGHWWYEGPSFLEFLFRLLATRETSLTPIVPSEYLAAHPTLQVVSPSPSSWGLGGYGEMWLNHTNDWIYRHLHHAAQRMTALANQHPSATGVLRRALNQAARELLLAQASDWAFIMRTGTTALYAVRRTCDHIARFNDLDTQISAAEIDDGWLSKLEHRDSIFPDLDYRVFQSVAF